MRPNNYAKVVQHGRIIAIFAFNDLDRDGRDRQINRALKSALDNDAKASVFRWRPGMPPGLGSAMPCSGLTHDWRPCPFDKTDTNHPGWTCGRCARVCSEKEAEDDPVVGRVPPHKEWDKHARKH